MAAPLRVIVDVAPDALAWSDAAADHIVRTAASDFEAGRSFSLVLTGGSTPAPLYRRLAEPEVRDAMDWSRTDVFLGDERCVPPDAEGSNWGMAAALLLSRVPVPDAGLHRPRGEIEPVAGARQYEEEIRRVFTGPPRFSLVLLGMGEDGHVASLFPGSDALAERQRLVVPAEGPPPYRPRLTMTYAALDTARSVAFLVTGGAKAARVAEVIEDLRRGLPDGPPAARLRPAGGELRFFLDRAAASELRGKESA